ncbi:MAG: VOC family protein [Anaerolineae bacterium]|jgi:predicted enzyme related to lactoylglutathione lyase
MLTDTKVRVSIPVHNMDRAKAFFTQTLQLQIHHEHDFAVILQSDETQISLIRSDDAGAAKYSLVTFLVPDIEAAMQEMRAAGIQFEEYNFGAVKTVNGKAEIDGDFIAWFKDSEGNLLAIAQPRPDRQ